MSPTVARTSNEAIVEAARSLVEAGGPDAVTMQAVAERVGIRAPSLYKRFQDRGALMTAVADAIALDLATAASPGSRTKDPERALRQMATRYRAFARRWPRSYQLLFGSDRAPATAPSPGTDARAVDALLRITELMVGAEQALPAARLIVAWVHGFVSMELAGAFRLGGNVSAAFDYGLMTLVRGLRTGA